MAKNLAVFFDGTWNEPNDKTNAYDLYKAALETDDQRTRYIQGVGTQGHGVWSSIDKYLGGAFGAGLSENIQAGYQWLCEQFTSNDRIYLFGFSRGAYSARSLAGMIRNCGLVSYPDSDHITKAYSIYRNGYKPDSEYSIEFRNQFSIEADIHFVGVWDTVGRLGIPFPNVILPGFSNYYSFHDTELSNHVRNAYHALAANEFREPYAPTYWTRLPESNPRPQKLPVEQCWFIGAHADVGGGYSDGSLQTLPAFWLQRKAALCGLLFDPDIEISQSYDLAMPHDSYSDFTRKIPFRITKAPRSWTNGEPLNLTCDSRLRERLLQSDLLKEYASLRDSILALPIAHDFDLGTGAEMERYLT
nr:DUF2235 domain-containing protein [uncultured Cupriavidus sp.]